MIKPKKILFAALLAVCLLTSGIHVLWARNESPELLVYCGITMMKPMQEIASIFEKQENCTVTFQAGGSGNLLRSIKKNKKGDLFLPGSDSYIKTCVEEGLITESVFVGYNKAAMMVRKGNPRNIPSDLEVLANPEYRVIIGNPNSGSIGQETRKILEKRGIFEAVVENTMDLTTDSRKLITALKEDQADVSINWYATSVWPENADFMEALPVDEAFASKKKLVLGLLASSTHPDLAKKFMTLASGEEGKELFRKYGLYDVQ